jgi:hypothetical protein
MAYKDPNKQRVALHEHYLRNRDERRAKAAAKKLERLAYLRSLKERPCADCGQQFPHWIMDFDHTRGEKKFCIGDGYFRLAPKEVVDAEIAKCDVVCANCHKDRTWRRQNDGCVT